MTEATRKADLRDYLREAREALLWKLDGLQEYDIRRPMTATGANLLGLVKHLSVVELLYLGHVFGRRFTEPVPWFRPELGPNAFEPNADMWATADQSRELVVDVYQRACRHSDATIDALGLDAVGHVVWWPKERSQPTLHRVLTHVIAETERHAGHADIVRELIDGAVGRHEGDGRLPSMDQAWWENYRTRVDQAAREAARN